jgi:hypothetical protein
MNLSKAFGLCRRGHAGSIVLMVLFGVLGSLGTAQAQTVASTPIKQGLWQMQVTSSMQMTLPPDLQAKIAAMPAAQQAQMQSMMGGSAAKPTLSTVKTCVASTMTPTDLINQAQQKGTTCKFTNQQSTASAMSFDMNCTTTQGTASGHIQFKIADSDHGTATTHMTVTATANGRPMNMTMDGTSTYTYLGADCGSVKPDSPVVTMGQ